MGCLRLLLAICVVISHNQPMFGLYMLNGEYAVEIFFMVSGFYMALILNEKYSGPGSYKIFISNRLLKIYPAYYACLVATIAISLIFYFTMGNPLKLWPFISYFDNLGLSAKSFIIAANSFIFGQDAFMFAGVDMNKGEIFFTDNFRNTKLPLFNYLLVPQAWSISIELMFYLIAPFIVRRRISVIIPFIAISFFIKNYTTNVLGMNYDPWTYRFFFSEVGYFLLGAVAYRLLPGVNIINSIKLIPISIIAITASFIIFFHEIDYQYKYEFLCALFFFAIPIAFSFCKKNNADRYIGELSYPVYLIHYIVSIATAEVVKNTIAMAYKTEIVLLISIFLSVLIMKIVINPIDRVRQKRVLTTQVIN